MPVAIQMPNFPKEDDPSEKVVAGFKAYADYDLKKKELEKKAARDPLAQELMLQRLEKLKEEQKQAEFAKTPEGRMQKLSGDQKGRLDNAKLALVSVQGMGDALNKGDNTFSLIGDNDFTQQRTLFEEALGRMQSGGAIGVEEADKFRKMAPRLGDSPEMRFQKLQQLQSEMQSRLGTLGFKPDEVGVGVKTLAAGDKAKGGLLDSMKGFFGGNTAQAAALTPPQTAPPVTPDLQKKAQEELAKRAKLKGKK